MSPDPMDRRALLRRASLLGLGLAGLSAAKGTTPGQTEGPFFPAADQADKDVDLTQVAGRGARADGEVVRVGGVVRDLEGVALSGVFIDVWQACASGRYNHPRDPNPAKVDPNFQYWARLLTDNEGRFQFKTIIPGAYPASRGWDRPPHIHFRVDAFGLPRLTTQMYFKGQPLNEPDLILRDTAQRYGQAARDSLVVDFGGEADAEGIPQGLFEITLGRTPEAD